MDYVRVLLGHTSLDAASTWAPRLLRSRPPSDLNQNCLNQESTAAHHDFD